MQCCRNTAEKTHFHSEFPAPSPRGRGSAHTARLPAGDRDPSALAAAPRASYRSGRCGDGERLPALPDLGRRQPRRPAGARSLSQAADPLPRARRSPSSGNWRFRRRKCVITARPRRGSPGRRGSRAPEGPRRGRESRAAPPRHHAGLQPQRGEDLQSQLRQVPSRGEYAGASSGRAPSARLPACRGGQRRCRGAAGAGRRGPRASRAVSFRGAFAKLCRAEDASLGASASRRHTRRRGDGPVDR